VVRLEAFELASVFVLAPGVGDCFAFRAFAEGAWLPVRIESRFLQSVSFVFLWLLASEFNPPYPVAYPDPYPTRIFRLFESFGLPPFLPLVARSFGLFSSRVIRRE
jgi:hypothetical protein